MLSIRKPRTVHATGAPAGSVLGGAAPWNEGLRLRVLQAQPASVGGPIAGPFEVLDAGTGKHAAALNEILGRVTDAAELLQAIRRGVSQCVHVVNANTLVVERA